jgi:hypothetical protein
MKLEQWELQCAIAASDVATILKILARHVPEVLDHMDEEWGLVHDRVPTILIEGFPDPEDRMSEGR